MVGGGDDVVWCFERKVGGREVWEKTAWVGRKERTLLRAGQPRPGT